MTQDRQVKIGDLVETLELIQGWLNEDTLNLEEARPWLQVVRSSLAGLDPALEIPGPVVFRWHYGKHGCKPPFPIQDK